MTSTAFSRYGSLAGVASAVLFVLSTVFLTGSMPLPGQGTGEEIAAYLADNAGAVKLQATLQGASALALLWFALAVASRLPRPWRLLTAGGGAVAAATLSTSVVITAVMAQEETIARPALLPIVQWLSFTAGGPLHAVWIAPLLIGAAWGSHRAGLLPKWLGVTGTVIGVLAAFSVASIAVYAATPAIPLGRYGGFLWMIAAAFWLVRDRAGAPEGREVTP